MSKKMEADLGQVEANAGASAWEEMMVFSTGGGNWVDSHRSIALAAEPLSTEIKFQVFDTDREHREQGEQPRCPEVCRVPDRESSPRTLGNMLDSDGDGRFEEQLNLPVVQIDPPCYGMNEEWCQFEGTKLKPGLWWHGVKEAEGGHEYAHTWISSPLSVEAITAGDSGGFGRLLRFKNSHGQWREWAMPMRLLKGSGEEMRGELLDQGVIIDPKGRRLLPSYIMAQHPQRRVQSVSRIGWHGDTFVLPARFVGDADVVFQSEVAGLDDFTQAGTADDWLKEIGRLCVGNVPLLVSVSAALAGPLLHRVNRPGGGIHWMGDSSTGKTTAIEVAASVWGPPEFVRSWSTTANGFEGVAATRNDVCMMLDEINEASPYEVGRIAYMLANGQGKQRAGRTGEARTIHRWRLMTLSTGERSLAAVMAEAGRKPNAGQLVRLLNIPVNFEHGVFSELHDFPDGRSLADHLKRARTRHYGHLGPAFLERLVQDRRDLPSLLAPLVEKMSLDAYTNLESRAAGVFAVVGMAGELAIEYDLLPWPQRSAIAAAHRAFTIWRTAHGQPTSEDAQILANISEFIGRHGDSRFSRLGENPANEKQPVRDRAGWYRGDEAERIFLFMAPALVEAGDGFDRLRIAQALDRAGWLIEKDSGRLTHKVRTPSGPRNLYHVRVPEDAS